MTNARYRMVAIDLDGTLLSPDGTVSPRARDAVHSALNAGLLVCFATGRNFTESRSVLEDVRHYGTAVFVSGAVVIDTEKELTLHRTLMDGALAAEVCGEFEAAGFAALALQDTAATGIDYLVSDRVPLNEATTRWMHVTSAAWKRVNNLATSTHEHTIRVGIVSGALDVERMKQRLAERFGERIFFHSVIVPGRDATVLEVFDPSVNKWEGILHVARHHGIAPEQIVAIGDDVNDLHMLRHAGLGVAMGNAKPPVKAIAKRVIGRNSEDGLAAFIEELVATHAVTPLNENSEGPEAA